MGNIISAGRPPTKACGECPFCPPTGMGVLAYFVGYDDMFRGISTPYCISLSGAFEANADASAQVEFSWGSSGEDNASYNTNARLGILVHGEVGFTCTAKVPYCTATRDDNGNITGYTLAGYVSIAITVEAEDIVEGLSLYPWSPISAYNIAIDPTSDCFCETPMGGNWAVGNDSNFAMPEGGEYYLVSY